MAVISIIDPSEVSHRVAVISRGMLRMSTVTFDRYDCFARAIAVLKLAMESGSLLNNSRFVSGSAFTGCGKSLGLGGAALQRCDKSFILFGGFSR